MSAIHQQLIDLGWHFNPLEPRNQHGEWTKDADAATSYVKQMGGIVPSLIGHHTHLDYDGQTPTLFSNKVLHKNVLAEIDWHGHMRISQEVADELRQEHDDPSRPIAGPGAYIVPLHEEIHATVPVGEDRSTNGDEAAYQDLRQADIEEGFTQLGTALHAPEFLDKMGLSGRKVQADQSLTLGDLAREAARPGNLASGQSWSIYPDQTARAYKWISYVAGHLTGKPEDSPETQAKIRDLTDEVNAVGTAAKPGVLAAQAKVSADRVLDWWA